MKTVPILFLLGLTTLGEAPTADAASSAQLAMFQIAVLTGRFLHFFLVLKKM